jgi:hypothetical protein
MSDVPLVVRIICINVGLLVILAGSFLIAVGLGYQP